MNHQKQFLLAFAFLEVLYLQYLNINGKEKTFLVDAHVLIYRSYYAFIRNPRINSKGQNTSAILVL